MQQKNMLRALALGSIVVGVTAVGCDKYQHDRDLDKPVAPAPAPEIRSRAAEETPIYPSTPTGISENTRKDQLEVTADQLKVQQDKAFDGLYDRFAAETGDKREKDVPVLFKSHCKSTGKGDSVMGTDKTKSFFAEPSVREKCAEIVDLDRRIDAAKAKK